MFQVSTPLLWIIFEFLGRLGPVAYRLSLPLTFRAHNVFHVYLLEKYIHDSNHGIDWTVIHVELEEELYPKPQHIMDMKETFLHNRVVVQVNVQWKHFGVDEPTWEIEYAMRVAHPFLFLV